MTGSGSVCEMNSGACVYSDCLTHVSQSACEYTQSIAYRNSSGSILECEWDSANTRCIRKTCGEIANLPCNDGSVRKPLNDYGSVCNGWYCDCGEVSTEGSQWIVKSILLFFLFFYLFFYFLFF